MGQRNGAQEANTCTPMRDYRDWITVASGMERHRQSGNRLSIWGGTMGKQEGQE